MSGCLLLLSMCGLLCYIVVSYQYVCSIIPLAFTRAMAAQVAKVSQAAQAAQAAQASLLADSPITTSNAVPLLFPLLTSHSPVPLHSSPLPYPQPPFSIVSTSPDTVSAGVATSRSSASVPLAYLFPARSSLFPLVISRTPSACPVSSLLVTDSDP